MAVLEYKQGTTETAKRSFLPIKNILFATDFSATSEAALPYVSAIAHRFGSTAHIAHVLSDTSLAMMTGGIDYVSMDTLYGETQAEAEGKVHQVSSWMGSVPCRTYVRHGLVWPSLSEIVTQNAIDLIVVGTHGRTGLGKLVLGSVAEDILRHAPCPVLTVGPKVRGRARLPEFGGAKREIVPVELELRNIVCATNLAPASVRVVSATIALSEEFAAQLTLVNVIEEYSRPQDRPGPIENGVRQLQLLVPRDARLAYSPETLVQFGAAWECIVRTADEKEADLIVLGAHPSEATSHVPWSTVHRVVAHANCPVLTVRG
jgi:nucleotide-binding universal stress UspA family protein